jgi:hypothetical protein
MCAFFFVYDENSVVYYFNVLWACKMVSLNGRICMCVFVFQWIWWEGRLNNA